MIQFPPVTVVLAALDLDESAEFYNTMFQIPGTRISLEWEFVCFGNIYLTLYRPDPERDPSWPRPVGNVRFTVDNLELYWMRASATFGLPEDGRIETLPSGERLFMVMDPFGNHLRFIDAATAGGVR